MISPEKIEEFKEHGVVVIEDVFSTDEVAEMRKQFHDQLKDLGLDHEKILTCEIEPSDGPRLKSKSAQIYYNKWKIYYNKWKIDSQVNDKVYQIWKTLMLNTFGSDDRSFSHPYGSFTDVMPFIDRVCYRLPDHIRTEGGLEMHLDRNPTDPYLMKSGGLKRWRPIQGFLTLTDHYGSESGGLKVVKGFHTESDDYFSKCEPFEGGGEFCRLLSKSHTKLRSRLEPINAPAGSLVMWDNRLAHSTCEKLSSPDTREVVYMSYLPTTEINQRYKAMQLVNMKKNIVTHMDHYDGTTCDKNWNTDDLTELQKRLLGFTD